MVELPERLGRLQDAANAAARQTQRIHLVFVLVCAYVALAVGATTHELLLRDRGVELPLLGMTVPIAWFCVIAPALVVVLHCQLLLYIKLLTATLVSLDDCILELPTAALRREQRNLLYPSLVARVLVSAHDNGELGLLLLRSMVWLTVCALPVALLTGVLVVFLPYHHVGITWFQRLAVLADLGLLWIVWGGILQARPGRRRELGAAEWWRYARTAMATTAVMVVGFVAFAVAVVPGERLDALSQHSGVSWIARSTDALIPRHLDLAGRTLAPSPARGDSGDPLGSAECVASRNQACGLDLRGRDLRAANFAGARLENADLRNANLEGADLQRTVLRGAVFTTASGRDLASGAAPRDPSPSAIAPAKLRGVTLRFAELDDHDLSGVALDGADLSGARLQSAALDRAVLRGATLTGTVLTGASLVLADLAGADLRGAHLQGANLTRADLRGADLAGTDLRGADLHGAQLSGANLHNTLLRGADLRDAVVQSACFSSTDLSLADLRGADLGPLSDTERQTLLRALIVRLTGAAAPNAISDDDLEARVAAVESASIKNALERVQASLARGCPAIARQEVTIVGALYDRNGALAEWPPPADGGVYGRELSAYLAELSCTDLRVAKALVWQYDPVRAQFGPRPSLHDSSSGFPAALSAQRCSVTEQLPPDIRVALADARKLDTPPAISRSRPARSAPAPTTVAARDRRKRSR